MVRSDGGEQGDLPKLRQGVKNIDPCEELSPEPRDTYGADLEKPLKRRHETPAVWPWMRRTLHLLMFVAHEVTDIEIPG